MDSPRLGLRHAAVTSWALVGVGIAGVASASALAYADTVKQLVADVGTDAAIPTREGRVPGPGRESPTGTGCRDDDRGLTATARLGDDRATGSGIRPADGR
jgi:hypothetical protein